MGYDTVVRFPKFGHVEFQLTFFPCMLVSVAFASAVAKNSALLLLVFFSRIRVWSF